MSSRRSSRSSIRRCSSRRCSLISAKRAFMSARSSLIRPFRSAIRAFVEHAPVVTARMIPTPILITVSRSAFSMSVVYPSGCVRASGCCSGCDPCPSCVCKPKNINGLAWFASSNQIPNRRGLAGRGAAMQARGLRAAIAAGAASRAAGPAAADEKTRCLAVQVVGGRRGRVHRCPEPCVSSTGAGRLQREAPCGRLPRRRPVRRRGRRRPRRFRTAWKVSVRGPATSWARRGRRDSRRRRRDRGARAVRTSSSTATVDPRGPVGDRLGRDGCSGGRKPPTRRARDAARGLRAFASRAELRLGRRDRLLADAPSVFSEGGRHGSTF